jgi:hypothetical protein
MSAALFCQSRHVLNYSISPHYIQSPPFRAALSAFLITTPAIAAAALSVDKPYAGSGIEPLVRHMLERYFAKIEKELKRINNDFCDKK